MEVIYISLGSNQGNRIKFLQRSKDALEMSVGKIIKSSDYYETEPWGFISDKAFINQVISIGTILSPSEVLKNILEIEAKLGRVRFLNHQMYTNRCIDIDILFYGQAIINKPDLIVPHQYIHERKFVLEPMNQINSEFVHPVFDKSISFLLEICEDRTSVKKYFTEEYSVNEF